MADPLITSRFAPAPTGYLHLGHVVNAVFVWGVTRAAGGRVLLRIEDHDRQRCRADYEDAILDDLDWLGLVPDEPLVAAFRRGACLGRQRDRGDVYEAALARLRAQARVYACECSRRARPHHRAERRVSGESPYPGTCATKGLVEAPGRGVRISLDPGDERFDDLRHGPQVQSPHVQCGDLLVRDREGNWTYQFAVTVDDDAQGVNLVIRGDDLLPSTGRQIQLARLLGRATPPLFLHHGLVMKSQTQKLSKADGDTSVREMRARGITAAELRGRAAAAAGLIDRPEPLDVDDLPALSGVAALGARAAARVAAA